jgi:hypothetical protein
MVAAEKILGFDARQGKQFRNLVERQSLFTVALQSDCLQRAPGQVCAGGGKPLGNFVGDMQRNFHERKFSMRTLTGGDGHFLRRIARVDDAEYAEHSLRMLECIAAACGVALKLRAEKKPNFDREVALV